MMGPIQSELVNTKARLRRSRRRREQIQGCPEQGFGFEPGVVAVQAQERARNRPLGKPQVSERRPYLRESVVVDR